jgi:hypothetical protein
LLWIGEITDLFLLFSRNEMGLVERYMGWKVIVLAGTAGL